MEALPTRSKIDERTNHVAGNDPKGDELSNGELPLDNQVGTYPKCEQTGELAEELASRAGGNANEQ